MIKKIFMVIAVCNMTFYANASEIDKPQYCPTVSAVKQVGLQNVDEYGGGLWIVWSKSKFQTNHQWTFALFVDEKNRKSAIEKATRELSLIKLEKETPEHDNNKWICSYSIGGDVVGGGVTPPPPLYVVSKTLKKGNRSPLWALPQLTA